MIGLGFLDVLARIFATFFLVAAILIAILESGGPEGNEPFRKTLSRFWRAVSDNGMGVLAGKAIGKFLALQDWVTAPSNRTDKATVFAVPFLITVFAAIPVMAGINAAFGGSSFLLEYYAAIILAVIALLVFGEWPGMAAINSLLALFVAFSVLVVIPGYVFWALTDAIKNHGVTHAPLESLLVAPILGFACYGVGLLIDVGGGRWRGERRSRRGVATGFLRILGSLSIVSIVVHVAWLFGAFGTEQPIAQRTSAEILVPLVAGGIGASLSTGAIRQGLASRYRFSGFLGFVGAFLIAWAMGIGMLLALDYPLSECWSLGILGEGNIRHLGPGFWLAQIPFLIPWTVTGIALTLALARAVHSACHAVSRHPDFADTHPFLATGILSGALSAFFWIAEAVIAQ